MNLDDVRRLVSEGESEGLEFKSSLRELKGAMETLCGFLNRNGGSVLLGVRENGRIVGQTVADVTLREIAAEIAKFDPPATIEIQRVSVSDSHDVLLLTTGSRSSSPYTYGGRPF